MSEKTHLYHTGYNKDARSTTLQRVRALYEEDGILVLFSKVINTFNKVLKLLPYSLDYALFNKCFMVGGRAYDYFIHIKNCVITERVVEIPFVYQLLKDTQPVDVLEVGNVLNQYFPFPHDVVDRYEVSDGVLNQDILDYHPTKRYDLIISISTVEHIGFDEPVRERGRSKRAIENIVGLLKSKGVAIITVPMGYNPEIDDIIKSGEVKFTSRYFLKRVGRFNHWKETTMEDALKCKYGWEYPNANAVAFLMYKRG